MIIKILKKITSCGINKFIILFDIYIHKIKIKKFLSEEVDLEINTIYDVGANNGEYSILFNKIFPKANIYAFEPNPYLCEILKLKLLKNKKISIIEKAAGNQNKKINIYIDMNSTLTTTIAKINYNSITAKVKKFLYERKNKKKIQIKLIKLDNFVKNTKCPDFIKIDVEGFEEEVLKGLKNNIKKIKIIMIEFHFDNQYLNYSTNRLHSFLVKNNFKHIKSIKFPILNWEDRFYLNLTNLN